ncbi:hypothetical protein A6A05_00650 [Magnetospirillum moscoviense]|uniref:GDP-mannose 4,6-dehydratase n=1 Tax=Magnetospirillum moscoviense TaxID=1437059 RepID=A0A178MX49_9PROT|nr:hypothetical protein A6A05_00650 [Magnetospirillum moscoviense]
MSGQDGGYLARHLLSLGYTVVGTTRGAAEGLPDNLVRLGIGSRVSMVRLDPHSTDHVVAVLDRLCPDELYMLSGQSSVGRSFDDPLGTFQDNAGACVAVLEALRRHPKVHAFFAGSSECFGNTDVPADCRTRFAPLSPYGTSKSFAFWQVATYRAAYGLHVSTGILFSHESPLRRAGFVTPRIISGAVRIAAGVEERLTLGPLYPVRDWGWAPEFVEAMHLMVRAETPSDQIIATGRSVSLEYFVERVFAAVGLDWRDHVDVRPERERHTNIARSLADVTQTRDRLGWVASMDVDAVVDRLVECERKGDTG